MSPNGTWWARQVPSILSPSTSFGPVQPLGLRSTIIGHRGQTSFSPARAAFCDRRDLVEYPVERRRHQLVHPRRVVAFDKMRLVAVADEQASSCSCGMRARIVGLAIL